MMIVLTAFLLTYFSNLADVAYLREEEKIEIKEIQDLIVDVTNLYNEIMREVNQAEITSTDTLKDVQYLKRLEQKLNSTRAGRNSGIILRIENEMYYLSDKMRDQGLIKSLPEFGADYGDIHRLDFSGESDFAIHAQRDFFFADGKRGTLFIGTDLKPILVKTDMFNIIFRRLGIGALLIIGFFIALSIYKEVQKSLTNLTMASERIKEGIYDHEILERPQNELGDVISVFEEMRIRLSESLEMQKKYEEDRKYMISSISHDLKTPIMSIKGYIQGIKDGVATSPEKHEKYMDIIYSQAENLETMINELFLYSKLDLQQEVFFFRDVDIVEYFRYCIEDLRFEIKKQEGEISLEATEKALIVRADLQKLKRVILNIFNNSLKYASNEKPKINIEIEQRDCEVLIKISDNGKGIPEESLPNIFNKFYRADKSRTPSVVGSGIGLAIVKQIILSHSGRIWAESKLGEGTTIYFTLPIKQGEGGIE